MTDLRAQNLLSTEQLAAQLGSADLRVLDCTVFLRSVRASDGSETRTAESGRGRWEAGHIPGSQFADLITDLSDPLSPLSFTMPSAERFAEALERLGVGEGTRVVCYDANLGMWATRVWWMLRAFGFEAASVLDGGLAKWKREGRPMTTERASFPPARFIPRPRPERIASKAEVKAAMTDDAICVVNALSAEQHAGTRSSYGRRGRIPGSVNVPAQDLTDPATLAYRPSSELRALFQRVGATDARRVIVYCGGGIAATSDALALTILGIDDVAVYDGSLTEWTRDPELPMETDA